MARLGSIIESVYAASDANGKFKSKDSAGERIRNVLYRDPYALRDDRLEFPSLDGSTSSASLDFSYCDEDSSTGSPRETLWQVPRSDSFAERNVPSRLSPLGWPLKHDNLQSRPPLSPRAKLMERSCSWESKGEKREAEHSAEVDMMKERFARLLLGEDMSGGRRGVSTALAISNAITNLSASVFGELWRLEPLAEEKKKLWRREMEWLLSVTDHIVELVPTWQSYPDGSSVEVMVSHPRADLQMNLPALRKLDAMLLECLDGFSKTEFWYVDQGVAVAEAEEHGTPARNSFPRQEEKWWLPTPKVPADGLSSESKKRLQHQKESVNQILKASMAINAQVLFEMDVPEVYWETLPKNGRASLGEAFYRCIAFEHFSPDTFLVALDLSTEHQALEVANRLEAAIHAWKRKNTQKHAGSKDGLAKSSSWGGLMKDLVGDGDKRELFIGRAESLLLCLKQKFPGLPQTLLDIHKIQYNKDVGQSILEGYSRVLESLAYSIISRIDDVLHVEEACRCSDGSEHQVFPIPLSKLSSLSLVRPSVSSSAAKRETELKGMTASSPKFDRPWKPLTLEPNTKNFSYARHLESGNSLHSPPGRD